MPRGAGFAWLPCWMLTQHTRSGEPALVMDSQRVLATEIHPVWPKAGYLPAKTRAAIDALATEIPRLMGVSHIGSSLHALSECRRPPTLRLRPAEPEVISAALIGRIPMRVSLPALAVCGALIVAGVAPAVGQRVSANDVGAAAASTPATSSGAASAGATPAGASAPISEADIKKALSQIRAASRSYAPCDRPARCSGNFDSFGVALTFNDGTMAPFAHEQRRKQSGHDCILNAREALQRGDRALAVQWVMAAHMDDSLTRNWLGDHPDAVLEGLRRLGG